MSSDHAPVIVSFESGNTFSPGSNYWKFNSQLIKNRLFCTQLIETIDNAIIGYATLDPQLKWEAVKYEIRKFCISFSKKLAKEKKEKMVDLEKNIKEYENSPSSSIT